jgi:hypothetical protein
LNNQYTAPSTAGSTFEICQGSGIVVEPKVLLIMPMPNVHSDEIPRSARKWAKRSGLTLGETEGVGITGELFYGIQYEGEFVVKSHNCLTILVPLPELEPISQRLYLQEHCDALANLLGAKFYWVMR